MFEIVPSVDLRGFMGHAGLVLPRQRHDLILEEVRRTGTVRVRDLAARLEVSEMTVRRDLDALADQLLVEKVHGGAIRIGGNRSSFEPGFAAKQQLQLAEKQAIARRALDLVRPDTAIGLTAGTTTWTFARLLRRVPNLTVVTNAPGIAQLLYETPGPEMSVVLTGGVRTPSDALVGPIATEALSRLHVDTLFLGVHGMDEEVGYSTPNLAEAELNAAFVRSARQVVVLADHTKWGTRGLARIAPLGAADVVITDRLPDDARRVLADHQVEVLSTDVEAHRSA